MIYTPPRLVPAGDAAILIEFADEIDDAINDRVHACAQTLRAQNHPAVRDLIPAYASLLVCFDPEQIAFAKMRVWLRQALDAPPTRAPFAPRRIEIPTRYGGAEGPDLAFLAEFSGLTERQVVELHASVEYRVYLIGFAPGFAYLGSVPDAIAAPRLATPRTRVPVGSVGIAGKQTGIYPLESPGGWRIIGRTTWHLFDPACEPPALLQPGDRVRFAPLSAL